MFPLGFSEGALRARSSGEGWLMAYRYGAEDAPYWWGRNPTEFDISFDFAGLSASPHILYDMRLGPDHFIVPRIVARYDDFAFGDVNGVQAHTNGTSSDLQAGLMGWREGPVVGADSSAAGLGQNDQLLTLDRATLDSIIATAVTEALSRFAGERPTANELPALFPVEPDFAINLSAMANLFAEVDWDIPQEIEGLGADGADAMIDPGSVFESSAAPGSTSGDEIFFDVHSLIPPIAPPSIEWGG